MSSERLCQACKTPLVRRENEKAWNFGKRKTCGKECGIDLARMTAKPPRVGAIQSYLNKVKLNEER